MGKTVKKIVDPAKKVGSFINPIGYVGTKLAIDTHLGKNPLTSVRNAAGDVIGTHKDLLDMVGIGGKDYGDSNANLQADIARQQALERAEAQMRMGDLINRTRAQAPKDRGEIESFGKSETDKANATNANILDIRKQRRNELASLLAKQADDSFKLSQPEIAESANRAGILYSSGYGEALAKEKSRLANETQNKLSEQALTDADAEISGIQGTADLGRGYRESGLSREFTLEDFAREGEVSKEISAMQTPSAVATPTTGGGGKGGVMGGAAGGAAAGSALGPYGALVGGGAGAILGAGAKKGK